jgi:ATP-dependent Clp protease protease subunit
MTLTNLVPMVVEQGRYGERAYDIYSLLLKERLIIVGTDINSMSANLIIAQLLFLSREDPERTVQMYIHSPGGEVYAGIAIYDTMQQVAPPISTTSVGLTASFGTVLLVGGTKGMRYALPGSTIHMHQPHGGGPHGQVTDMMIQVKEFQRLKQLLIGIFQRHTGQSAETLERDMERDVYLTPEQAVEYGLIDAILEKGDKLDKHGSNGNGNGKK